MEVSVVMVTYGHENFIRQAIEGVLKQDCTYDFELIIANDCSTDKTDSIVKDILENHPNANKIKYICQKKNIGMMNNFLCALKNGNGKYFALCDGDDYWTDPFKLQKQVDFLEANIEFSICFTDYVEFYENKNKFSKPDLLKNLKKDTFTRNDIILNNFIPTLTAVFHNKKEILSLIKEEFYPADWFIHILNSKFGKIKFLPFESAVYRIHNGGVCSSSDPIFNNDRYLKSIDLFKSQFKHDLKLQFLFKIVKIKIRYQSFKIKLLKTIKKRFKQ